MLVAESNDWQASQAITITNVDASAFLSAAPSLHLTSSSGTFIPGTVRSLHVPVGLVGQDLDRNLLGDHPANA